MPRPRPALIVTLLLTACTAPRGVTRPDAAATPNVLVILVDDLGAEALGCYGGTSYATPNVDRLAARGMRFTRAHTTPLCTPTRVRMLTGRSAPRSYVAFSILSPEERTFANELRDAGWATAVAGKWQLLGAEHYGEQAGTGQHPRDAGFDAWCLWQVEKLGARYDDPQLDRDGELVTLPGRYGPDVACDYLIDFVRAHAGERFLAYYPMILTHDPFEPTPASADRDAAGPVLFADMVAYMDALVGRLLATLDELRIAEETLVVFATDNGSPRAITSTANGHAVAGGKGLTTDAGTHVPLIVVWPGVVAAGSTCDGLVDLMDVGPTLIEACGVAPPSDRAIDGKSLWPQLRGRDAPRRDLLTFYFDPRPGAPKRPPQRWALGPRYKLYGDGRLYDVLVDPLEQTPLDPRALDADPDGEVATEIVRLRAALAAMPAPERITPRRR
ncbi:MAG: sulfatase-like hydrolase/transferase [Planctomycetes bacterium]|nr:sulfatase-like hydrolase/transferase [Planctomycetota bacterium]